MRFNANAVAAVANELSYIGSNFGNRPGLRRFKAKFGCSPTVAAKAWILLEAGDPNLASVDMKQKFLWSLIFLKIYEVEEIMSDLANVDEKTFRKWGWYFVDLLSWLEVDVIVWDNRYDGDIGNDCLVSVDGADFRVLGRKKFSHNKPFWSYKFKAPGLRYEVGLNIITGGIVWVNGPYLPGMWNDLMIFRDKLKWMLGPGERVEADDGYVGDAPTFVKCPSTNPPNRAGICQRVRSRHETVNKRMKQFGCLVERFRHDTHKHSAVFRAVAVITQLSIESGEPLFDCREYNDAYDDNYVANVLGL